MTASIQGYRAAAHAAGVSVKTVERWKREGLKHRKTGGGIIIFERVHLLAFKRWKLLTDPSLRAIRLRLQSQGIAPVLTHGEIAKMRQDYTQAGGRL